MVKAEGCMGELTDLFILTIKCFLLLPGGGTRHGTTHEILKPRAQEGTCMATNFCKDPSSCSH